MMNLSKPRELPADVYDALELGALSVGGIGAKSFFEFDDASDYEMDRPVCAIGLAAFVEDSSLYGTYGPVRIALSDAGIYPGLSDHAVYNVNTRLGVPNTERARVSFPDWASELGITRGVH